MRRYPREPFGVKTFFLWTKDGSEGHSKVLRGKPLSIKNNGISLLWIYILKSLHFPLKIIG